MLTTITKKTLEPDQRMAALALLLDHFIKLPEGGQLIIHFGPGTRPKFIEIKETLRTNPVDNITTDMKQYA